MEHRIGEKEPLKKYPLEIEWGEAGAVATQNSSVDMYIW